MIGKTHAWLSDAEYTEFNEITYDKITSCDDLEKLKRLERYMREEGFPQTADVARQTIIAKGGSDPCQTEPPITESEVSDVMKNIQSWETSIKGKDEKLRELQTKTTTQDNGNWPAVRKSPYAQKKEAQSPKRRLSENDPYNGQENLEKSDKNTLQSENGMAGELTHTDKGQRKCAYESHLVEYGNNSSNSSKTAIEREWCSQHEREKGNDLYKAKEYTASIDAYSHAIELFPESPIAYCNRAAAFLKTRRWAEAYKDCCTSLEIDPIYVKALVRRGVASLKMENPKDALKDFEEALALDPTNREIMKLKQNAEDACERYRDQHFKSDKNQKINCENNGHKPLDITPTASSKRLTIEEVDRIANAKTNQELSNCERLLTESGGNKQQCKLLQIEEEQGITKELQQDGLLPKTSGESYLVKKNKKVLIQEIYGGERLQKSDSPQTLEANIINKANINKADEVKKQRAVKIQELDVQQETRTGSDGIVTMPKSDKTEPLPYFDKPPTQLILTQNMVDDGENINQVFIKKNFSENVTFPEVPIISNSEELYRSSQTQIANEWQTKGYDHLSKGEICEAIKCYTQSLSFSPDNASTLSDRALCHLKLKNFEAAVEDSSKAISLDPGFIKSYHHRGLARRALKRLEEAREDLQKVLDAQPGDKSILDELGSIEREREESMYRPMRVGPMVIEEIEDDGLSLNQNVNSGASVLRTANGVESSSSRATSASQGLDAETARSSQSVYKSADMLAETSHQDYPLHMTNNSSLLTEELSTVDGAAVKRAEQYRMTGNMQVQKGEYVAAVNSYSRSIESNPLIAATYANRALCYIKLESLREAEQDCTEAIRLDPYYTKAYYRRAIVLQQLGDLRGAFDDLKVALEYLPEDREIQNRLNKITVQLEENRLKQESCSLTVGDQSLKVHQSCGTTSTLHEKEKVKSINSPVHDQVNVDFLGQTTNVPVKEKISAEAKLPKPLKIPAKPRTALDFERSCLCLQNHSAALKQYLKSVDVNHFPDIFKESLGTSTMKVVVASLQKAFMSDDPQGAFNILDGLTKVRRFKLAMMLMAPDLRLEFVNIFEWLIRSGQPSQESVLKLKEQYIF